MRARLSMATSRNPQDERKRKRFLDRIFEDFGQMMAVQFAGQAVVTGEKSELTLVLIALVDDA